MNVELRTFKPKDFNAVSRIYEEGIATGMATFETDIPDWTTWNKKYSDACRIVASSNGAVVGFAVLSEVSKRDVYKGVAEVSVYVKNEYHGNGIGESLLKQLIIESEAHGFWTLQASIFSENIPSIALHEKCGFRTVGIREKIGKLKGTWHDNHFLEKRSKIIN
jgi:phosphinothricin acetyltransferase